MTDLEKKLLLNLRLNLTHYKVSGKSISIRSKEKGLNKGKGYSEDTVSSIFTRRAYYNKSLVDLVIDMLEEAVTEKVNEVSEQTARIKKILSKDTSRQSIAA